MPVFAGNALLVEVQDLVSKAHCHLQYLPLHVFSKRKHFELFVNKEFPVLSSVNIDIRTDIESTLWRNYRKWFGTNIYLFPVANFPGIPRIVDFIFTHAHLVFGSNIEYVFLNKEQRLSQLTRFDKMVTKQTGYYYNLTSVKASPYLLVSVAAGIPTSRLYQIPGTEITFGNYELKGYLFPVNDNSANVLWASNLLSFESLNVHEGLSSFVKSRNYEDLDLIKEKKAVVLDSEFDSPADMLKMVLFDSYLMREFNWKCPLLHGDGLEYAVSITIWLRYLIARVNNNNDTVPLKDIIYSLPSQLKYGKLIYT